MTTREYNELFIKMNIQTPQESNLITGPKFFNIINEFDPAHEDYNQFMEERRRRGLSTSRKTFCKEVLENLDDDIRESVINRINQIADDFENGENEVPSKVVPARDIFDAPTVVESVHKTPTETVEVREEETQVIEEPIVESEQEETPTLKVFISYSWDNEEHEAWILKLAKDLATNGIEIILDKYELKGGKNMSHFMENAISNADKVLMIFTENYKLKADHRTGGVGYEYSILNTEVAKDIAGNSKYIPILREGSRETSIPSFIQQFNSINMSNDANYDRKIVDVIKSIFDMPLEEKPVVGEVPSYVKRGSV